MEKSTTEKYKPSIEEILKSLGIKGKVLSCGFNPKQKVEKIEEKVLIIQMEKEYKLPKKR